MKRRFLSVILASLMVAGMVGMVAGADNEVTLPDDKFETEAEPGTTAPGGEAADGRLPKGIVFKAESGYKANTCTGYVSGIEPNTDYYDFAQTLENGSGIGVVRETADGIYALRSGDAIKHGDRLERVNEAAEVVEEFTVIFMGNADKNDTINISDASMMLKLIAGWDVDADAVAADVNGDGVVNLSDVTLMLQKVAGWNVEFVKEPVLPGRLEMVTKGYSPCFQTGNGVTWQPITLSDGIHYDVAVKFNVAENEFATKIEFLCHSMSDNEGEFTISVYKWKGDYDTTVASMPVISEKFVDYPDNTMQILDTTDTSGKGLGEGEYMWRIHEGYDDPDKAATGVGIYFMPQLAPDESTGIKTFLNCKEFNFGPVANIFYSTAK